MMVLYPDQPFSSRERIERIIRQYVGRNIEILFEIRDAIPVTASGKRRVTVSHLYGGEQSRTPMSFSIG